MVLKHSQRNIPGVMQCMSKYILTEDEVLELRCMERFIATKHVFHEDIHTKAIHFQQCAASGKQSDIDELANTITSFLCGRRPK